MSGGFFLRAVVLALAAVYCAQLIRNKTPAMALLISLAAVLALVGLLAPQLRGAWQFFQQCLEETGLDREIFSPVMRVLAVTQITHLTAELCRDAGERAIAAKLELCGAVASVLCVMPLARQALALIGAFGS